MLHGPVHSASDTLLPSGIAAALREHNFLYDEDAVEPLARGNEATCYLVRKPRTDERIVVKLYHHQRGVDARATHDRCVEEFRNLGAFGAGVRDVPGLAAPVPMALIGIDGYSAIVMPYVAASPLPQQLVTSRLQSAAVEQVGRTLVHGLRLYHEAVAECYGDPAPDNILLSSSGTIFFIDPGYPSEHRRRARLEERRAFLQASQLDGMLASDIAGLWAGMAWWTARRPWRVRHVPRFGMLMTALLRAAAAEVEDQEAFRVDVYRAGMKRHGRVLHGVREPWHIPTRALAKCVLQGTRGS